MAAEESVTSNKFDRLFTKQVPHILEGIFFSLDYESLHSFRKKLNFLADRDHFVIESS